MISGGTRVFALLGRPVAHSLSPRMHNAAFAAMGLDAVYVALDCGAESVASLIHALAGNGGGGNVTVPHKAAAACAVTRMHGVPAEACNTFWGEDDTVLGANTDVDGVLGALEALGAEGKSWLIVGTGLPLSLENFSRKCWLNNGMSPVRMRNGGSLIGITSNR